MEVFCKFCGKIIPEFEKIRRRQMSLRVCRRFKYMYTCCYCNKGFDYRELINHKILFKNTLEMLA